MVQILVARNGRAAGLDRGQDVANPLLGAAVHRRAVDDAAARLEEAPDGRQRRVEVRTAGRHVEHLPGSEAERGQLFARTRNRALDRISGCGSHARCSEACEQSERFAPRQSRRRFFRSFMAASVTHALRPVSCQEVPACRRSNARPSDSDTTMAAIIMTAQIQE